MFKTILGKFEKGKIIPLQRLASASGYRIYITLIPVDYEKKINENQFLSMAKKADLLFRKGNLREVRSLKELD